MRTTLLSLFALFCSSAATSAGLDATSHVFVIVMENHNWSSIKGSADAPYINNTLLPMASYCDQYYTPPGLHPSEPNYLWLEAGTNFGITNDGVPYDGMGGGNHQSSTAHFATQLNNAGITWKAYQEDIDGVSCPTADSPSDSGLHYAVRHNPFAFFDDVVNAVTPMCVSVMRPFSELATDLMNHTVAQYNFITPSTCNDMHDSCAPTSNPVKQGDDWLAANLPMILGSPEYQNSGLIIITFDEGENGTDGPIGCIVLSPFAKGGGYHNSIRYTHSATLRTLQKIFGVAPFLGGAATAPDLSDLFVAGAIPNADAPTVTPPPVPDRAVVGLVANANGRYVTAENAGNSPLIANRSTFASWERFQIQDLGNGYIALRSLINNLFVCAENAGTQRLIANRNAVGLWEQFKLVDAGNGQFALMARVNGKYVCAENAGSSSLIANRDAIGSWEQFSIFLTLRAVINNNFVCAENGGNSPLIANRGAVGEWEQFQFFDAPTPGYFALKAKVNGKFVCAENAGNNPLIANRTAIGQWEQFQWIAGGNGNIAIKALVNGFFVTAENAGNNPLIANRSAAQSWEQFQ